MSLSLVCPSCHYRIKMKDKLSVSCERCDTVYHKIEQYWNLTVEAGDSDRYETNQDQNAVLQGERASGRRFVQRYLLPKLEGLVPTSAKILSVGCGLGEDVAELRQQGYESYGIELWSLRASKWPELERSPEWYYLADALKLPFEDNVFDIVLCIGLIEHIGTVGKTSELHHDSQQIRAAFLGEMVRVAKHGVYLATPNRTFPADFHHSTTRSRLLRWFGGRTGVWFHSPSEGFYLSYQDIEGHLGNLPAKVIPWEISNHFGFAIRSSRPWVRLIIPTLNLYFRILDRAPHLIRKSWLNPWVSVFVKTEEPTDVAASRQ